MNASLSREITLLLNSIEVELRLFVKFIQNVEKENSANLPQAWQAYKFQYYQSEQKSPELYQDDGHAQSALREALEIIKIILGRIDNLIDRFIAIIQWRNKNPTKLDSNLVNFYYNQYVHQIVLYVTKMLEENLSNFSGRLSELCAVEPKTEKSVNRRVVKLSPNPGLKKRGKRNPGSFKFKFSKPAALLSPNVRAYETPQGHCYNPRINPGLVVHQSNIPTYSPCNSPHSSSSPLSGEHEFRKDVCRCLINERKTAIALNHIMKTLSSLITIVEEILRKDVEGNQVHSSSSTSSPSSSEESLGDSRKRFERKRRAGSSEISSEYQRDNQDYWDKSVNPESHPEPYWMKEYPRNRRRKTSNQRSDIRSKPYWMEENLRKRERKTSNRSRKSSSSEDEIDENLQRKQSLSRPISRRNSGRRDSVYYWDESMLPDIQPEPYWMKEYPRTTKRNEAHRRSGSKLDENGRKSSTSEDEMAERFHDQPSTSRPVRGGDLELKLRQMREDKSMKTEEEKLSKNKTRDDSFSLKAKPPEDDFKKNSLKPLLVKDLGEVVLVGGSADDKCRFYLLPSREMEPAFYEREKVDKTSDRYDVLPENFDLRSFSRQIKEKLRSYYQEKPTKDGRSESEVILDIIVSSFEESSDTPWNKRKERNSGSETPEPTPSTSADEDSFTEVKEEPPDSPEQSKVKPQSPWTQATETEKPKRKNVFGPQDRAAIRKMKESDIQPASPVKTRSDEELKKKSHQADKLTRLPETGNNDSQEKIHSNQSATGKHIRRLGSAKSQSYEELRIKPSYLKGSRATVKACAACAAMMPTPTPPPTETQSIGGEQQTHSLKRTATGTCFHCWNRCQRGLTIHQCHETLPEGLFEIRHMDEKGKICVCFGDWDMRQEPEDWRWLRNPFQDPTRIEVQQEASAVTDPVFKVIYGPESTMVKESLGETTLRIVNDYPAGLVYGPLIQRTDNSELVRRSESLISVAEAEKERTKKKKSKKFEEQKLSPLERYILTKLGRFFDDIQEFGYGKGPPLILKLRRKSPLNDAYDLLMAPSKIRLHYYRSLRIIFVSVAEYESIQTKSNFIDEDESQEFFQMVSRKLFGVGELRLFVYPSEGAQTLHLNPDSQTHPQWFAFAGVVLGLAFLHQKQLNLNLSFCLIKALLDRHLNFKDLQEIDPSLHKKLMYLKDNKLKSRKYFVIREQVGQRTIEYELMRNGKNTEVTEKNKFRYIELAAKWKLAERCLHQTRDFHRGFKKVLRPCFLTVFSEQEILSILRQPPVDKIFCLQDDSPDVSSSREVSRRETW